MSGAPEKVGSAYVEVGAKEADGAGSVTGLLSSLGKGVAAGVAVATTAVVGFAASSVKKFSDVAAAVDDLQDVTGESAEVTSRLQYAFASWGISADDTQKMMLKLSKAVGAGNKDFEKYNIATKDAQGNTLPMSQIVANAADQFAKMPDGIDKADLAMQLFGKSGTDVLDVMNQGSAGMKALGDEADKYGITIGQKAVDAQQKNAANARKMHAAWEGLQIQIGQRLMPAIAALTGWLADQLPHAINFVHKAFEALQPVFDVIQKAIGYFWDGVTDMGTNEGSGIFLFLNKFGMRVREILAWLKEHWPQIKQVIATVMEAVGKAIAVVVEDVLPAVIHAVRAVVEYCIEHWPQVQRVIMEVFDWIKTNVVPIVVAIAQGVAEAFGAMVAWVRAHWEEIKADVTAVVQFLNDYLVVPVGIAVVAVADAIGAAVAWIKAHWDQISADVTNVWNVISTVIGTAIDVITTIVQTFISVFQTAWGIFGGTIETAIGAAWELIKGVFQSALDIIIGVWNFWKALFTGDWQGAWNAVKDILFGVWEGIKAVVQGAIDGVKIILSLAWDAIKAGASVAWDGLKAVASAVWDGIKEAIMFPIHLAETLLSGIWDSIKSDASLAWGLFVGIIQAALKPFQSVIDGIKAGIDAVVKAVQTAYDVALAVYNKAKQLVGQDVALDLNVNGIVKRPPGGATGGVVKVGEHGTEIVSLPYGSSIHKNGTVPADMAGGGGGTRIGVQVNGGLHLHDEMDMEALNRKSAFVMAGAGVG